MRPAIQCAFCEHFRSPLDQGDGTGGPTCDAFPLGIPDPIWLGEADHREPYPGDGGVRFEALPGTRFPEHAVASSNRPVTAHYPGGVDHGQWKHGRKKLSVDVGGPDAPPADRGTSRPRAAKSRTAEPVPSRRSPGRARRGEESATFARLTPSEAQALQNQMLEGKPWTPEQREALDEYTGGDYDWINGSLRDPARQDAWEDDARRENLDRIGNIREAMRPLPGGVTVTRNTDFKSFGIPASVFASPGGRQEALERLKGLTGKTLQEPGFLSTSIDEDNPFPGWVVLQLKVQTGTPAAYLASVSGLPNEHELLLAAGLKMKIESVDVSGSRTVVHASALPYERSNSEIRAASSAPDSPRTDRPTAQRKMSALSDPGNLLLHDVDEQGDVFDDPAWRMLLGLDQKLGQQ